MHVQYMQAVAASLKPLSLLLSLPFPIIESLKMPICFQWGLLFIYKFCFQSSLYLLWKYLNITSHIWPVANNYHKKRHIAISFRPLQPVNYDGYCSGQFFKLMNLPFKKWGTLDMQKHSSLQGHHHASLTCSLKQQENSRLSIATRHLQSNSK